MRSLLVLIDGLGDDPIPAWQGETPFEYAVHPIMDEIVNSGSLGNFSICEQDITPESCSCILRLLGVSKDDIPKNRAYLELLANNRDISEYEMVLRCNLAAVDASGKLIAFNGQGLTAAQMQEAVLPCDKVLKDIEFIHLSEYRNLLIMNREEAVLSCFVQPPHESVGEDADALLYSLRKQSLSIDYFLKQANEKLAVFNNQNINYILYPWGASARQTLPAFSSLHNLKGGAVCKAEIVLGIARALGMETCVPSTATGDVDTDVYAKAEGALTLFEHNDFVIAHFNGTDEAAHRYDYQAKVELIEKIDKRFLQTIVQKYHDPLKLVICGDHVTSSITGRHSDGTTPVVAGYLNTSGPEVQLNNYHDILNFLMKESD